MQGFLNIANPTAIGSHGAKLFTAGQPLFGHPFSGEGMFMAALPSDVNADSNQQLPIDDLVQLLEQQLPEPLNQQISQWLGNLPVVEQHQLQPKLQQWLAAFKQQPSDQQQHIVQQLQQLLPGKAESNQLKPEAVTQLKTLVTQATNLDASSNKTEALLQQLNQQQTLAANEAKHQWAQIKVDKSMAAWSQQLLAPVSQRLQFQASQGIQHASMRLDPPEMGKIELTLKMDGDKLNVQVNASNPAVRDALAAGLDRLKQDLSTQTFNQVSVDVSGDSNPHQHQQQLQQSDAISANPGLIANESKESTQEQRSAMVNTLV